MRGAYASPDEPELEDPVVPEPDELEMGAAALIF